MQAIIELAEHYRDVAKPRSALLTARVKEAEEKVEAAREALYAAEAEYAKLLKERSLHESGHKKLGCYDIMAYTTDELSVHQHGSKGIRLFGKLSEEDQINLFARLVHNMVVLDDKPVVKVRQANSFSAFEVYVDDTLFKIPTQPGGFSGTSTMAYFVTACLFHRDLEWTLADEPYPVEVVRPTKKQKR